MKKAAAKEKTEYTGGSSDSEDKLTVAQVLCNFRKAYEAQEDYLKEAKDDVAFALGNQWDPEDVQTLKDAKVRPLTINQISPILRLLKGIEAQNRTEMAAFPEGDEDSLPAEIITRLIKNMGKKSDRAYILSDTFDAGNASGKASVEPYLIRPMRPDKDGNVDLNAELRYKMRHYNVVFPDPSSVEYDMSDAQYVCKWTPDLSKEQLLSIFPKQKELIEEIKSGKIKIDEIPMDLDGTGLEIQRKGYEEDPGQSNPSWIPKKAYDLIDYFYMKQIQKWYAVDAANGKVKLMKSEADARRFVSIATASEPALQKSANVFSRYQTEMWVAFVVGGCDKLLYDGPCWSWPRYDGYPIFNYYAYRSTAPVDSADRSLLIKGITRDAKDSNRELNKRRTQELRHLGQTTNSGWIVESGSLTRNQEAHLKKFGGSPGVIVTYVAGKKMPERIEPASLSQGHAQMAMEHRQDLRDTVGINTETLAVENDQSSGKAINARVRQGMVQVFGLYDNFARTKRNIGRFEIAMLPLVYDVNKAKRVLGKSFLFENFQVPIQAPVTDKATGQPVMGPDGKPQMQPIMDPRTGAPATQYDENMANEMIKAVLEEAEIGVYDVAVGEIVNASTMMQTQFEDAMSMRDKGIPIPGEVLLDKSALSEADKKKSRAVLAAMQQQPEKQKKAA